MIGERNGFDLLGLRQTQNKRKDKCRSLKLLPLTIDVKIPFTTTLENELYKAWIKIQGLSGKTQYSIEMDE